MPLTLSLISTQTSPSLKLFTSDFPRDTPRNLHISTARLIFEFPAKILILSSMFGPRQPCCRCIYADTVGLLHTLDGAGGFEPPNAGIKILCLTACLRP